MLYSKTLNTKAGTLNPRSFGALVDVLRTERALSEVLDASSPNTGGLLGGSPVIISGAISPLT